MNTHTIAPRIFGIFFLISFLSYGIGSGLVESVVNVPNFLSTISNNQSTIIVGILLMTIIHTIVNIGLAVIMHPILKTFNSSISYGYLSATITSTVIVAIGGLFLLLLLPLSDAYVRLVASDASNLNTIGFLLKKAGFYSYQIGMAIWGVGGWLLCSLLYKSKLVPRLITICGFIGYIIFIAGTILELFGYNVGVIMSIPAALFEISLSIWLIVKGFNISQLIALD
tara:strand:+ start:1775 stop:2452 length:678 start_codon:yes stop_codon:yes gene_type:complete